MVPGLSWWSACAIMATSGCASLSAAANDCDRACLKTSLDQYLSAVIKHDPAAAPLFVGFRQTENAVVIKLGTGVWKSVTALGRVQRRYVDAVTGQAAYFGTIEESGSPAVVTVRVRVEHRKITEAEWYIARKADPGLNGFTADGQPSGNAFDPDNLAANPPREKYDGKGPLSTREAMIAATNSYFDGITTHDGSIIMAHQGCNRVENGRGPVFGLQTGGGGGKGGGRGGGNGGPTDCTSNLQTINIEMVAARRYPIVDEEAGVVLAMAIFIRKPGTTTRRNVFSEWFVIDDNKIRSVYSAMFYPTSEVPAPNWPPYDGNWPLPPSLAPPAPPAGR
jgi:hypothetical protein